MAICARPILWLWTAMLSMAPAAFGADVDDAEVVAALEKAGASSSLGDATPFAIQAWRDWGRWVPWRDLPEGARSVPGSFTRPAARERLVFEPMGEPLGGGNLTAVGLVDEHGTSMLGWTSRGRRHFLGLCRDAATDVDHVMVERWAEGNCCANELEFWAHDAAAGALRLAYSFEMLGVGGVDDGPEPQASSAWPDEDGRCRWRERKAAEDTLSRALQTLQVGALPSFGEAGPTRLPTRALAGDVVVPLVEAVRGMPPEVAETRDVLIALASDELADGLSRTRVIESDRWEILAITGSGRGVDGHLRSDEVILVHDRSNQAWHSMLDCADLEATDLRGDVLFAELGDTSGGCGDDSGPRREVRIDLGTWEVRSVPAPSTDVDDSALAPGDRFRDCPACPEMVVVPAGEFTMGSPSHERCRGIDEGPQRWVHIAKSFAVGVYEVTFDEWDLCHHDLGCGIPGDDRGRGRGTRPAINLNWHDVREYVHWLSGKAREYRLLSEAEWEYVTRAGTTTPFHFGWTVSADQANYNGYFVYGEGCGGIVLDGIGVERHRDTGKTVPVGSFGANDFGLYDVHGNVWEWVQDCWNSGYDGGPGWKRLGVWPVWQAGLCEGGLGSAFRETSVPRAAAE